MEEHEVLIVLVIFAATLFLSAALMFLVQPMFGKMVLPRLGGSPAVWNTEVAFCQGILLLGYLYAHLTARWFGIRRQALIHCFLIFLPLLLIPIGIPKGLVPPAVENPIPWLLSLLLTALGLPLFVVATNSPMLQNWFSNTQHPKAGDPYFLYAASNTGSLMGLLGYPVLVEPYLHLQDQGWIWGVGYGLLILLTLGCAITSWRSSTSSSQEPLVSREITPMSAGNSEPVTTSRRIRWVLGAFVPSSLMLSVTTYLSINIAPVPLLWVIPLSIYLLTFILVFARRTVIPHRAMVRIFSVAILPLIIVIILQATQPIWLMIAIHLMAFFIIAMVCHGAVANDRPVTAHLTEFYLWVSFGGVMGGAFNAVLAPVLFPALAEYPLILVLSVLLLAWPLAGVHSPWRWSDLAFPAGLGVLAAALIYTFETLHMAEGPLAQLMMFGIPTVICYSFSVQPLRFGLGLGALLLASSLYSAGEGTILHRQRNFFGVHRILLDPDGGYHLLSHSGTLHGKQSLDASRRCEPLTYYHPTGPLGQVFTAFRDEATQWRVAAVGLGAGSIASYQLPGQRWTFYEVDPTVIQIAQNPSYFTYLSDCSPGAEVIPGDARLTLARESSHQFELIVLDAYSSDSIPIHLITREAIQLYLDKLTQKGLLLFHISNQYLDFRPVVANLAQDAGLVCFLRDDLILSQRERALGKEPSRWVVMSRNLENLAKLAVDPRWQRLTGTGGAVWTDSYSSIFSVLN
ncbi:fused MFS/spermidine synthase [Acidobacteria bacterium AH-259-D05]|nr:fused MFS/spermidine synthase [Acidobacteria bacterium AH-259-D05]